MTRLLVVSPDNKWSDSLQHEFEAEGMEITSMRTEEDALSELVGKSDGHYGGILVHSGPTSGRSQEQAVLEATDLLTALRLDRKLGTPIVLWAENPPEHLSNIARRFEHTSLLTTDTLDTIKAALLAASGGTGKKPSFARIEIEIGRASLRVLITVDGRGTSTELYRTPTWKERLQELEDEFRKWALLQRDGSKRFRYTDYWDRTFERVGKQLAEQLDKDKLRSWIAQCVQQVDDLKRVHFRFSLVADKFDAPHPYVHVPFELLYDTDKSDFIRSLAPVARRMCLNAASMIAAPLASAQTFTGPLLFIKSNAHGSYEIPGTRFKGDPELVLSPLESLDTEFEEVTAARAQAKTARSPPLLLELEAGSDSLSALEKALQPAGQSLEIVHFTGHSVQADDGNVYLILPGRKPGQLLPIAISEFASLARDAGVHLVVLSSCQSSTPDAVFRLAQAGIPAVIGFRWEVDDSEAPCFTGHLHRSLADAIPLARAFHGALCEVRRAYPGSPTFASPMLVVQNEEWTV
ncbi:CHAT domain-containing protein [Bradyrhizobium sp. ARR65]|uniref:CHAT domain-containing protein n=1 Tax=Bradyrhizobium sp. ARR65 TaxID=1040989 RepID=UPI000466D28D|nr:CHAT domain-containing protein [Bradyrhizobium sp. ARR65]